MNFEKFVTNILFRVMAIGFLAMTACSPAVEKQNFAQDTEKQSTGSVLTVDEFKEQFGIEVVALMPSAAGHMLDFRFRVVDVEKAMPFFREDINPYILDPKSGKSLTVPVPAKLGPMRPTGRNPKEGVTYWMFFGNPGLFDSGDKLTIVVGDYRLENLTVE